MTDSGFLGALASAREVRITFVGRKSGKKFTTPVWFVEEQGKLYLLPVSGSASQWYRSVLKNPVVELQVSSMKATAKARPVRGKSKVDETMDRFRAKYGDADVERYYQGQDAAVELVL